MPSNPIPHATDGELPHGSYDVTTLETGQTFVANNFKFDENSKKLQSMDSAGRVARNKVIPSDVTGSADFQLADKDTQSPRPRESFGVDADKDGNIEPYMVEKSGRTFEQDGEFKSNVSIFACANPLIYDSVTGVAPVDRTNSTGGAITATNALAKYLPRDVTVGGSPFSATGLPTGLTMAAATGIVTGTPTVAGTYSVTYKCTGALIVDGVSKARVGVRKFTWTIT